MNQPTKTITHHAHKHGKTVTKVPSPNLNQGPRYELDREEVPTQGLEPTQPWLTSHWPLLHLGDSAKWKFYIINIYIITFLEIFRLQ